MKDEIKEILEFDFESQGERIEINEYERNQIKDYITNLQEKYDIAQKDIETLTNNYNDLVKMSENKINILQEENERLKELCNKYEEEHSTAFNLWKTNIIESVPALSDMQEQLEDYKSRIDKTINDLDILIEIIYQQPTENNEYDMWLLDRLSGIKLELQGEDNNE